MAVSGPGRSRRHARLAAALGALVLVGAGLLAHIDPVAAFPRPAQPFNEGRVLVGYATGPPGPALSSVLAGAKAREIGRRGRGALLAVPPGQVLSAVTRLRESPLVRYAEPDYLGELAASPNDPGIGNQWALQNLGQAVNGVTGRPGADENALAAWQTTTGTPSVVVAEVDTGVDYTHPDLQANIWTNPGSIGGCAAGTHGYNALTSTCDPMDDDTAYGGHGTHVAGIIGAVGNNGIGVSGVNWSATILPVKTVSASGVGATSDLLAGLDWLLRVKQSGVNIRIVNDSQTWKGTAYSQALSDEIDLLGSNGILFVTAGGNTSEDNDNPSLRRYPCGYDRSNEVCAAASNSSDALASYANRGASTVDLAAPGDSIYSTLRAGAYGYVSGSSMAAAQVSGAAALLLAHQNLTTLEVKAALLQGADPLPSLAGVVRSGGRLDVCRSLGACAAPVVERVGTTTVGGSADAMSADRKRVNRGTFANPATVTSLSAFLAPTGTAGTQALTGVLYADAGGSPGTLIATTSPGSFSSTQTAGWVTLPFPSPVAVAAGSYWFGVHSGGPGGVIGFRYDSVPGARAAKADSYADGPSSPFGAPTVDSELMSVYLTDTPSSGSPAAPFAITPPSLVSTASTRPAPQQGEALAAGTGDWTGGPTSFGYQWDRCSVAGAGCAAVAGATGSTYVPASADVGLTLRVRVTATAPGGSATSASPPSLVVATSTTAAPSPTSIPTPSPTPTPSPSPTPTTACTAGTTTVGPNPDTMSAQRKRANRISLAGATSVSKLSAYLAPTGTSGAQDVLGMLYADSGGTPGALLGVTAGFSFSSTLPAGWYDLVFPAPLALSPGTYWIGLLSGTSSGVTGFRWSASAGARAYNANSYANRPSNPFGTANTDGELMSLYASCG